MKRKEIIVVDSGVDSSVDARGGCCYVSIVATF